MEQEEFNFSDFLEQSGYSKEEIKESDGKLYCTNFQKETELLDELTGEKLFNSITVFKGGKFTAMHPSLELKYRDEPVPADEASAKLILSEIE